MNLVISVGAFNVAQIRTTLYDGQQVIAYEPRKTVYEAYQKIKHQDFKCFPYAVSGKSGKAILNAHKGDSTICPVIEGYADFDKYSVDVVSMSSVLLLHDKVHRLILNCEGSEISIIMETPLKLFERCEELEIEFHAFCPHLNISKESVNECVVKLERKFISYLAFESKPSYNFKRIKQGA